MRYIIEIVAGLMFIFFSFLNAEGYENSIWRSVYIGPKYTFDDEEHNNSRANAYFGIGLQFYYIDAIVNVNPFAILVALETRVDIGIRIYETNNLMIRLFTGFGDINLNERRGLYNDFIVIGCDVGFYKMNSESCCLSLMRDESRIIFSIYFERLWKYFRAYDSINAGIGCRW